MSLNSFQFHFCGALVAPLLEALKHAVNGLSAEQKLSLTHDDMQRSVIVLEFSNYRATVVPGITFEAQQINALAEQSRANTEANVLASLGDVEAVLQGLGIPAARAH